MVSFSSDFRFGLDGRKRRSNVEIRQGIATYFKNSASLHLSHYLSRQFAFDRKVSVAVQKVAR